MRTFTPLLTTKEELAKLVVGQRVLIVSGKHTGRAGVIRDVLNGPPLRFGVRLDGNSATTYAWLPDQLRIIA